MFKNIRACLWLLSLTVVLCCVVYPLTLLVVGQTLFHSKAEGSLVFDHNGAPIGSRLIAQPFSSDEYFHPRPSAVSYNAAASGASNWGANNYLLRDRVARTLGPIVKYESGPKKGQLVASDIEAWFRQDHFQGKSGIVSQWAGSHPTLASNWVKADPLNAAYVTRWHETHGNDVDQWKKANPDNPQPKPEDLAGIFFDDISKNAPGRFPCAVTREGASEKSIELVDNGTDIQLIFFDMWQHEHAEAQLEPVPADLVTASGSGLDPHITMKSALYQLDRVSAKWAELTKSDVTAVRESILAILKKHSEAPLRGLVGVKIVNVLETNMELHTRFAPIDAKSGAD